MKLIIILLITIFSFTTAFSQSTLPYPLSQSAGNDSILLNIHNAQTHTIICNPFTDTVAANTTHAGYYNGAVIATNSGQLLWERSNGQWVLIATEAGVDTAVGNVRTFYNNDGKLINLIGGQRTVYAPLNTTLQFNNINTFNIQDTIHAFPAFYYHYDVSDGYRYAYFNSIMNTPYLHASSDTADDEVELYSNDPDNNNTLFDFYTSRATGTYYSFNEPNLNSQLFNISDSGVSASTSVHGYQYFGVDSTGIYGWNPNSHVVVSRIGNDSTGNLNNKISYNKTNFTVDSLTQINKSAIAKYNTVGTLVKADSSADYATHTALVDTAAAIRASSGGGSQSLNDVCLIDSTTTTSITASSFLSTSNGALLGDINDYEGVSGVIDLQNSGTSDQLYIYPDSIIYNGDYYLWPRGGNNPHTIATIGDIPDSVTGYVTPTMLNDTAAAIRASSGGGSGTVTSVAMAGDGTVFGSSISGSPITTSGTFTLSLATQSAYKLFGNNTGSTAAPTFFSPTLASALFANQGTTTTLLHGNASGNPSWSAVSLTNDITGVLGVANGGTGSSTGTYWGLTGTSGTNTGTNFLGTTDNASLAFRTNNIVRFYIDSLTGNLGIKTKTPDYILTIEKDGVGNVSNDSSVALVNKTPATSSIAQHSPSLFFSGNWFNTSTSTSLQGQWKIFDSTVVNSNANNTSYLAFYTNNGSGWTSVANMNYGAGAAPQFSMANSAGSINTNNINAMSGNDINLSGFYQGSPGVSNAMLGSLYMGGNPAFINPSAYLEMDNTSRGFLMPRMTTTQMNAISSPANGLQVYNTSFNQPFFYNGSAWQFSTPISGAFSATETGATTVTVTLANTMLNSTYTPVIVPTSLLAATGYYISAETTTTFTITYITAITGSLTFNYSLNP